MRPGVRRQPSRGLRARSTTPRTTAARERTRSSNTSRRWATRTRSARTNGAGSRGRRRACATPRPSGGSTSAAGSGASSGYRARSRLPERLRLRPGMGRRLGPRARDPAARRGPAPRPGGELRRGDGHRGRRAHPGPTRADAADRLAAEARRRLLPDDRERRASTATRSPGGRTCTPTSTSRTSSRARSARPIAASAWSPWPPAFCPATRTSSATRSCRTLGGTSRNRLERLVPWRVASRVVDQRYKLSEQPLARKPAR